MSWVKMTTHLYIHSGNNGIGTFTDSLFATGYVVRSGCGAHSPWKRSCRLGPVEWGQRAMKRVVAALILKDQKFLVCQRTRHQTMPLKWEFPGGKIEEGEQPRDALRRELDEELGINATIGEEVHRVQHQYSGGGAVELRFFLVETYEGEIENRIFREVRWATRGELPTFDFLEADLPLVKDLSEGKTVPVKRTTTPGFPTDLRSKTTPPSSQS